MQKIVAEVVVIEESLMINPLSMAHEISTLKTAM